VSNLHIYTAPAQPATDFIDCCGEEEMRFQYSPRHLFWCVRCRRRRWAGHLVAQVYYDGVRFWCASGHGCKT
jgi:hypothetical protein